MADAKNFNLALDLWLNRAVEKADHNIKAICLEALEGIIRRTPVDTGFLRSNWAVAINVQPPTVPLTNPERISYADAGNFEGRASILTAKAGDRVIIYNPTAYAVHQEHGTAKMPGKHMVKLTLLEIQAKYSINGSIR